MIDFLGGWITSITAAAILTAVALTLTPPGGVKKAVQLVCGVVLTLSVLTPVVSLRAEDFALSLPAPEEDREWLKSAALGQTVLKELIQERTGAYIVSKAQALGLDARAAVEAAETEDGLFLPVSVRITTRVPMPGDVRETFARWLAEECGIAPERQQFVEAPVF